MTEGQEVLSALVDGEAVDAELVGAALEVPANRALLVDFIRLRHSVQRDDEAAPAWRPDRSAAIAMTTSGERPRWLRVAAILALLGAGAVGGTGIQNVLMEERPTETEERPPEPTRIVQLEADPRPDVRKLVASR